MGNPRPRKSCVLRIVHKRTHQSVRRSRRASLPSELMLRITLALHPVDDLSMTLASKATRLALVPYWMHHKRLLLQHRVMVKWTARHDLLEAFCVLTDRDRQTLMYCMCRVPVHQCANAIDQLQGLQGADDLIQFLLKPEALLLPMRFMLFWTELFRQIWMGYAAPEMMQGCVRSYAVLIQNFSQLSLRSCYGLSDLRLLT